MKWITEISEDEDQRYTVERSGQTVTQCGKFIFVLGGQETYALGEGHMEDAVLDTKREQWYPLPTVLGSTYHCACLVDDRIITIGGYEAQTHGDFASMYAGIFDVVEGKLEAQGSLWAGQKSLPKPCYRHIGQFFESKRELVVFGGREASSEFLDQLFALNVDSMQWKYLPSKGQLPPPQSSHLSCIRQDVMFVLCNFDDAERSDLYVMDYSRSLPHWSVLKKLGLPPPGLYGGAINLVGHKLIVFGGYLSESSRNDLFVYDLKQGSWSKGCFIDSSMYGMGHANTFDVAGEPPPLMGRQSGVYYNGAIRYIGGDDFALHDKLVLDLELNSR